MQEMKNLEDRIAKLENSHNALKTRLYILAFALWAISIAAMARSAF